MSLHGGRLRISDVVSLLLNPSLMTGVFFCALAARFEPRGAARLAHDAIAVVFAGLLPVGLIFVLMARGRLSDAEMSVRAERERNFLLCVACYAAGTILLLASRAPWPLWGLMALHVPNTLVLVAANRRLKVSIHTMVLTSLFVASILFFGLRAAPLGLLVLVSAWARWDAGNHSPAELACGIAIGGLMTPLEIWALRAALGV
jgi:hypothetical protein